MKEKTWLESRISEFEGNPEFKFFEQIFDFSRQICDHAAERGMSRSDLAKALGKNKSYVTRVLNGNANVTLKTMIAFASALGLDLSIRLAAPSTRMTANARTAKKVARRVPSSTRPSFKGRAVSPKGSSTSRPTRTRASSTPRSSAAESKRTS